MRLVFIVSLVWSVASPTLIGAEAHAAAAAPARSPMPAESSDESLAPTTAPPWNPSAPIPSRRGWEHVVNFPGTLLSLPFIPVGVVLEDRLAWAESKGYVPTGPAMRPAGRSMLSVSAPHMGGRAGFGASVELRRPVFRGAELGVRYAGTIRSYNGTFVRLTGRPLGLVYGNTWRPQEGFYGIGAQTPADNRTNYSSHAEFVRLDASTEKPANPYFRARTVVSGFAETRYQVLSTGRDPDNVSWETQFPELAASLMGRQVEHLVYGVSVLNDARAGEQHWSHGTRFLAAAERHDAPLPGLALHVGAPTGAQFNRYTLEGETGTSFGRTPRTLRVLARVVDQDITANADQMLITDLSTLGGTTGLAGFHQGRFYDVDLLHLKTSYIFPISRRLELDLHSEWGSVYGDVWRDAKFTNLQNSYGVALRAVYVSGPVATFGLNFSQDGARVSYSFGRVE